MRPSSILIATCLITGSLFLSGFAENEDVSAFQVVAPIALRAKYPQGFRHSEALFGIPQYGGSLTGVLVYATKAENQTGCSKLTRDPSWPQNTPIVVMVDRGSCDFVEKVRHAEDIHAVAAVIVDNKCTCGQPDCVGVAYPTCDYKLPVMADDGAGGSVQIPSYLITKHDGQQLKDCMSGKSDCAGGNGHVVVKLSWELPKPDNRVEWDMWTSTDDMGGMTFKDQFESTALLLGSHTLFTPRYFIYDGSEPWRGCTLPHQPCGNQCVYGGKYCNPDPNHNLNTGLSGADVVLENLRRICIWQQANATYATKVGKQWWDYVRDFNKECWSETTTPEKMKACSTRVQHQAGLDPIKTFACVTAANVGPTDAPNDNTLLANELSSRSKSNIFITPTIMVNGVVERGGTNQQAVLTTICNGFMDGTQPEVCKCTTLANGAIASCVATTAKTGNVPISDGLHPVGVSYSNLGLIIGGVVLGVGVIAGVLYFRNKIRYEARLRSEVRNILQEYMPLNEDGDTGAGTLGNLEDEDADLNRVI